MLSFAPINQRTWKYISEIFGWRVKTHGNPPSLLKYKHCFAFPYMIFHCVFARSGFRGTKPRVPVDRLVVNEAHGVYFKVCCFEEENQRNMLQESRRPRQSSQEKNQIQQKQVELGGDQSCPLVNPTETQLHLVDEPEIALFVVVEVEIDVDEVNPAPMESV